MDLDMPNSLSDGALLPDSEPFHPLYKKPVQNFRRRLTLHLATVQLLEYLAITLWAMYTLAPHYDDSPGEPSGSGGVRNDFTVQEHGTDLIGQAILFERGQFAGRALRAELREIQQADLGRKYARVDRRPLDPPPVVQLCLYEVFNCGMTDEFEEELDDYDNIQTLGLLCTVDLFPIRLPGADSVRDSPRSSASHSAPQNLAGSPGSGPSPDPSSPRHHARRRSRNLSHPYALPVDSQSASTSRSQHAQKHRSSELQDNQVIYRVEDFDVTESSKMTHLLVGATFVQPNIVEYQGKKTIFFVFADLAVKTEGRFILRYRVFDLLSRPKDRQEIAIQAQCYGGAFRVYSTKEFPGLQASTELTKQLARWGVRLNTRETERRRNKRSIDAVSPSPGPSIAKRPHRNKHEGGEEA